MAKLPVALLFAPLTALAACAVANTDVEVQDDQAAFLDGRISYAVGPRAEGGEQARGTGPAISVELDGSFSSGADEQRLGAGEVVVVETTTFSGPRDLDVDFDLARIRFGARVATSDWHRLSAEILGGIEYDRLAVDVRSDLPLPSTSADTTIESLGVGVGLALVWSPLGWLNASIEGATSIGFSAEVDYLRIDSFEVGLTFLPFAHGGLFAGWRSLHYEAFDANAFESDIELDLSGPVLALRLGF